MRGRAQNSIFEINRSPPIPQKNRNCRKGKHLGEEETLQFHASLSGCVDYRNKHFSGFWWTVWLVRFLVSVFSRLGSLIDFGYNNLEILGFYAICWSFRSGLNLYVEILGQVLHVFIGILSQFWIRVYICLQSTLETAVSKGPSF